ncbi:MAG: patatin-like phospholipase family protein [bacterium]|nr:patatin-like phospholipase family protein [bacterium]
MRGLVISGGGGYGAYAIGILKYLIEVEKLKYDVLVGTSTGALIVPAIALGAIERIIEAYRIDSRLIFIKGIIPVLINLLTGKNYLYRHFLLRRIKQFYTPVIHRLVQRYNVAVCVVNYTLGRHEYIEAKRCNYEKFVNFMLASASIPILMSAVEVDGMLYCDGGLTDFVPVRYQPLKDCDVIDIIVLKVLKGIHVYHRELKNITNIVDTVKRTIDIMHGEITEADLRLEELSPVTVNLYSLDKYYLKDPLDFRVKNIDEMIEAGYQAAKEKRYISYCRL